MSPNTRPPGGPHHWEPLSEVRALVASVPAGATLEGVVAEAVIQRAQGEGSRLRSVVYAMLRNPDTAVAGSLGAALLAERKGLLDLAMKRFADVPPGVRHRYAPEEYLRTAFGVHPTTGIGAVEELMTDREADLPARTLVRAARLCLAAGNPHVAREALVQSGSARCDAGDAVAVAAERAWLWRWVNPLVASVTPLRTVTGVSFGLLDSDSPDGPAPVPDLPNDVQSLAVLAHLARHRGVHFRGPAVMTDLAGVLGKRLSAPHVHRSTGLVTLTAVSREASIHENLPADTWLIAHGSFGHRDGIGAPLPFHPHVRPLFVSFSMDRRLLSPTVRAYLRRYGPIGCRDWTTVDLLRSAGIPAFFTGCLAAGISFILPDPTEAGGPGREPAHEPGTMATREIHGGSAASLAATLGWIDACRRDGSGVATTDPQVWLAVRAMRLPADLRPAHPADPRLNGLRQLDAAGVSRMAAAQCDLLEAPLAALLAGRPVAEVYATWRSACAPMVAAARRRHLALPPMPAVTFDVVARCREIRRCGVHVPATAPRTAGTPVQVALTFDANLAYQARVVVAAILANTRAPVHLWLVTRQQGRRASAQLSRLFPEATITWLMVDDIDYGPMPSMLRHLTTSSLDRLLLPELLPDVPRLVYQDIDALAVGDVAELAAWDVGGAPLAACDATATRSGFVNVYHAADALADRPEVAYELIQRVHARHAYDFTGFNSGVMVLDLDRMRRDRFCGEFLPYVQRYRMMDQQVLNCYTGPNRAVLPGCWNVRPTREIVDSPRIIHWVGTHKPWHQEYVPFQEVWRKYEGWLARRTAALAPGRVGG